MTKGQDTRHVILLQALELSRELGLEGLTIGSLAKAVGMSKSGLYAHFDSKVALQRAVLDTAAEEFVDLVMVPALKQPRGLPRVEEMFERWLLWEHGSTAGGCPFVAAAAEFDDRPGPVRDALVGHFRDLLGALVRAVGIAIEEGHLKPQVDPEQFSYQVWSNLLGFQHYARLMDRDDARDMARGAFRLLVDASR